MCGISGVSLDTWTQAIIPFAGGIIAALAGAWGTIWLQRHTEKRKGRNDVRFRVYMKLIELKGPLFWMLSAEVKGLRSDPKFEYEAEMMTWRIADELRQADDLEQMENVLRVLFSKRFRSVKERYEVLESVLNQLSKACNPRYCDSVRKINDENMQHYAREFQEDASRDRGRPDKAAQSDTV